MASKVARKGKLLAALVTDENRGSCAFCGRNSDDEIIYGKLYAIGDLQCHYFCVLFSCCLIQKGKDTEGLFGFMYPDIRAEIERSKKHRCSYCGKGGASLGCCMSQCRKQFHLPCGRERNAVSLYYGTYKSFCSAHAPKQSPPAHIARRAKTQGDDASSPVCVICYEPIGLGPAFWPPCCAKDAWLHKDCLQRMSLSAGLHYLRCPLCNDQRRFIDAVMEMGYYVPDRDASWELEQNAFSEIYSRTVRCDIHNCLCENGRAFKDNGEWDIKPCLLCGTSGIHVTCLIRNKNTLKLEDLLHSSSLEEEEEVYVCDTCQPAAPKDLKELKDKIQDLVRSEQPPPTPPRPLMATRMSLRRTKGNGQPQPTSSNSLPKITERDEKESQSNTRKSRELLNLQIIKSPRKHRNSNSEPLKSIDSNIMSPMKLIYTEIEEKINKVGAREKIKVDNVLEIMKDRCTKPKPLSVKKHIANKILDNLLNALFTEVPKEMTPLKPRNTSTKKCLEQIIQNLKKSPMTSEVLRFPSPAKSNGNKHGKLEERCIFVTPYKQNETPNKQNETPNKQNETPNKQNETSNKQNEIPNKQIDTPSEQIETPNKQMKTPSKQIFSTNSTISPYKIVNEKVTVESNIDSDSDSNSFQLPPEFIANTCSDDEFEVCDTPKKTTVNIEKDSSLEISSGKESVEINVTKQKLNNFSFLTPIKTEKCVLKMSPNKAFIANAVEIDLDSFKNQYLNEVGSKFSCGYNHKHKNGTDGPPKLKTAIDFAYSAYKKEKVNKSDKTSVKNEGDSVKTSEKKRRGIKRKVKREKFCENDKKRRKKDSVVNEITVVCSTDDKKDDFIDLTLQNDRVKKSKKNKKKNKKSRENFKVKIKWREEKLNLKITKSKDKKKKNKMILQQYVLKCTPDTDNSKAVLIKPEKAVTPIKKKYKKNYTSPDNLFQTSLMSFFKPK